MENDKVILEELSNTYEQLNIFYNWYERVFTGITSKSKLSEALSNIVRATNSLCAVMVSIGRGKKLSVVSSWTSSLDLEKKVLVELESQISEIEGKLQSEYKIPITVTIDDKQMYLLIVPWKTNRIINGVFIYARDSRPYDTNEQVLLGNSSIQLGVLMDSSIISTTLDKNNHELGLLLTKDISEFDNIFKLFKDSDKEHCSFMSKFIIPEGISIFAISSKDWKVLSSSNIESNGKNIKEVLPSGIVDMIKKCDDYEGKLPDNKTIIIQTVKNQTNEHIGSSVIITSHNKPQELLDDLSEFCRGYITRHHCNAKAYESLSHIYTSRLISMSRLVDTMHPTLSRRLRNINLVLRQMGMAMGLSSKKMDILLLSAKLLDVSLIYLDYETLERYLVHGTSTLNSGILRKVHDHPHISAELLRHLPNLKECITIVKTHHERWDGLGYPEGLKGEDIPPLGRILHLAQSLAFRTENHFADALDMLHVKGEVGWLVRQAGRAFDPRVVQILLASIDLPIPEELQEKVDKLG